MTKYIHKDKKFFEEVCKLFPSFSKRFQEACESQMKDGSNFIFVKRSNCGGCFSWSVSIPKSDIEVKEYLKPYVWYGRGEFDGNPNDYLLLEDVYDFFGDNLAVFYDKNGIHRLGNSTKRFMYIERPE